VQSFGEFDDLLVAQNLLHQFVARAGAQEVLHVVALRAGGQDAGELRAGLDLWVVTHPAGRRVPEAEGPESAKFLAPAVDLPDYLVPLQHLAGIFRGDGEEDERRGGQFSADP